MSFEAQVIAEQKDKAWEYRLTHALFQSWISPIEKRWQDLQNGLYAPSRVSLPESDFFDWISVKNTSLIDQIEILKKLVSKELAASWGPPGEPGSVDQIKRVCGYLADVCTRLLELEESFRAVRIGEPFSDLIGLYKGSIGPNISEVANIERTLDSLIQPDVEGKHQHTVTIALPPEFVQRSKDILSRIRDYMGLDEDE